MPASPARTRPAPLRPTPTQHRLMHTAATAPFGRINDTASGRSLDAMLTARWIYTGDQRGRRLTDAAAAGYTGLPAFYLTRSGYRAVDAEPLHDPDTAQPDAQPPATLPYLAEANGQRWDLRQARAILSRAGHHDSDDQPDADGFHVAVDMWDVRVLRVQGPHLTRPRPGPQRDRWDQALTAYADALTAAGGWQIRRGQHGIGASAPVPPAHLRPQVEAKRLGPVEDFTHRVVFPQYPHISGTIQARYTHASSGFLLTDHEGTTLPDARWPHLSAAVRHLAHWYGLPGPAAVCTR